MGTINSAFGLIPGALNADQAGLNVLSNNVANANTQGYAREIPNWQENPAIEVSGIWIGTGVSQAGPTAQRDRVLEERLDQQKQLAAASSARLEGLNNIQALFPVASNSSEATAGDIGSAIAGFFDSFASLEADPTNNALREQVLSTASMLAGDIAGAASSLNSQLTAADEQVGGVASQVNSLAQSIAKINSQIQSVSPQADAGELEDQRQQYLSQLSQLIGINQVTTEGDGLSITTASGQLLVSQGQSFAVTTGTVNGVTDLFLNGKDITSGLVGGGGQLDGLLSTRDLDIPGVLNSLDKLAYGIATAVNAQNNAGVDLNGDTGTAANPLNIFNSPGQVKGSAAAMTVVMTDPDQIAAAGVGSGTGDNSNAIALAKLAGSAVVAGQAPINYYSDFVSSLGAVVLQAQSVDTAQNASVTQLQSQRDALSGVNLNDEAAALSLLETSYQAASRVFGILNTIMASALNLGEETAVT
jgi:flagellar hook-associated protein 1 FlgK